MGNEMPERPRSDRALDEAIARRAVEREFPDIDVETVERLGEGWAADAYLLNGGIVLRFPRNAEVAEYLDADEAMLRFVASSLDGVIAVPRVVLRGRAGPDIPHGFLGCTYVPGIGADDARAPRNEALAVDLGRALTRIHSVPVEPAERLGLTRQAHDTYDGEPRFLHGDFTRGNLIVDPGSGRLTGVIDWGNAAIGDPALDFHGLVLWRGWAFARSVLDAYGLRVEDDFVERIAFHARIRALEWLIDSVRRRADTTLHLEWVRNAFSIGDAAGGPG